MFFRKKLLSVFVFVAVSLAFVVPVDAQESSPSTTTEVSGEEKGVTKGFVRTQIADLDKAVRDYYLGESNMDDLVNQLIDREKARNDILTQLQTLETQLAGQKSNLSSLNVRLQVRQVELDRLKAKMRNLALGLYMSGDNHLSPLMLSQNEEHDAALKGAAIGIGGLRKDWSEVADDVERMEKEQSDLQKDIGFTEELIRSTQMSISSVDARIMIIKQDMIDESHNSDRLLLRGLNKQEGILTSLRALDLPANAAKNPILTVLGESSLSPEELIRWFEKERGVLVVGENDVALLAKLYVEEGQRVGVRGDVAFVQAVLETGGFEFTGKNNFAGIGHCDNCPRGFPYDTPLDGVRAQLQLLRGYADRNVTNSSLPWESLPGVGVDRLGVKGCCYTWWGLSGVWASALHYGGTILSMYEKALQLNNKSPFPSQRQPDGSDPFA